MKKSSAKKRTILIIIIAVITTGIIGGFILNSIVQKKFRQTAEQLMPVVEIKYADIHTNLFTASVSLDSLDIFYRPDTGLQSHSHHFYFPHAQISGINFFKFISSKDLSVATIKLDNAEIKFDRFLFDKKDSSQIDILSLIHIPFDNLAISSFSISGANVWIHSEKKDNKLLNGNILVNNIVIHHLNKTISKDSVQFKGIMCSLFDINYPVPGSYHTLQIKEFEISSKDSLLHIDSLKLLPEYGKFEYGNKVGHQVDRVDALIPQIKISGLDLSKLLQQKLSAQSIVIVNSNVHVFRDRRLPRQLKEQPMPLGYLEKIPLQIHADTFKIKNADIVSEEFPKVGPKSGYIKIENLSISMLPFLNHRSSKDPDHLETYIEGSIMGSGTIHASVYFPLIENKPYIVKGAIYNLELTKLNPSAQNLGKMYIQSGVLNNLLFQFSANDKKASGEIVGEYHDLVIDKLKDDGITVAKLPSFALRNIIIPKNKDKSLEVQKRTGKIDYDRDPTRLVTFYLLKALLSGIRASFDFGFLLPS